MRLDANRVAREYLQYHPLLGSSLTQLPGIDAVVAWRTGGGVTRLQFLHDVLWVAKSLPDHANVINVCDDRYLFMVGFAAAILRGQVSLLPPSRVPGAVMAIAEEYANSYLLVDGPVGDGALPKFRVALAPGATAAAPAAVGSQPAVPLIDLDQLVVILFTSGTTGQATPNPKAWRTVVHGAAANAATLRPESDQPYTLVATVPSQHMYGFERPSCCRCKAIARCSAIAPSIRKMSGARWPGPRSHDSWLRLRFTFAPSQSSVEPCHP